MGKTTPKSGGPFLLTCSSCGDMAVAVFDQLRHGGAAWVTHPVLRSSGADWTFVYPPFETTSHGCAPAHHVRVVAKTVLGLDFENHDLRERLRHIAGRARFAMRLPDSSDYSDAIALVEECGNEISRLSTDLNSIQKRIKDHATPGHCPTWSGECRCTFETLLKTMVDLKNERARSSQMEKEIAALETACRRAEQRIDEAEGQRQDLSDVRRSIDAAMRALVDAGNAARAKDAAEPAERKFT